ncbi:MAG: hypothetical protein IPG07_02680 [Crocinitomicaceae bacterium]|nr:hypothetical protein [Crocinitomicaceae bacterium]
MSKSGKIGIIVGVVIGFLLLLYFFGGKMRPKEFVTDSWEETYRPSDKGPYGTFMLKELLDTTGLFGNFLQINNKLENELEDAEGVNDIYFFVGRENYLTEEDQEFLFDFISNGNTAYMMCEFFPYGFMKEFTADTDSAYDQELVYDSLQTFRFNHSELASTNYKAKFIYNNIGSEKYWTYFDTSAFYYDEADTLIVSGTNSQSKPNFLKIQYGNGMIFLHSTPYLFTNISLMKKDGFDYAEKVLRHIPPGRVQWDRYNLEEHIWDEEGDGNGGAEKRQSILQFILAHPPLAWATVLLLIGAFLYAVFKGKRMQKVIPAAESKENTSLGYINTLSSLYLQENKHQKLIRLKEKTFLNFIADHYYIISKEADEKFISKVALKSQIEKEKIAEIFKLFRELENLPQVSDDQLILLHQKIEYFYKKCR